MHSDPVLDCSVGSEKRIDLASLCFFFLPMIVPNDRSVVPFFYFFCSDDGVAIAAVPNIG